MDDDKQEEPETAAEVDDLDLDEPETEAVKGGSGGDFSASGGFKHPV